MLVYPGLEKLIWQNPCGSYRRSATSEVCGARVGEATHSPRTHPGASSMSSRRVVARSAFMLPLFDDTIGPISYQWYMHPPGRFPHQCGPPGFFLPHGGRVGGEREAGCSRYGEGGESGRSGWFRVCHDQFLFLSVSEGKTMRNLYVIKSEYLFYIFREIRSIERWSITST